MNDARPAREVILARLPFPSAEMEPRQLGRYRMQGPLASSPARKLSRNSLLYGRLSIITFGGAFALLAITLAIVFTQNGGGDSAKRGAFASSEFSSGMPLP
jgi:hypothetical protein